MELHISKKQRAFIAADADEVLFGGAAGGGKSYGQMIDALLWALKYPGSKQLILRRTYPELERSLILTHLELYPRDIYSYNSGAHRGRFANGSLIEFGYCDSERDVYKYQSAEYDCIRFDELTHFTDGMYVYLQSRVRGANRFPKQIKSSTNPGGVGHAWVKKRFIDPVPPLTINSTDNGTRIFIPAGVRDNRFLMESDPGYIKRLERLSDRDRRALLDGNWDILDGLFFSEFDPDLHIIEPFPLRPEWERYFAMDYGFDMLAGLWIAMDNAGNAYVYREAARSNLIIRQAAELINTMSAGDRIAAYIAPPDMWNRRQDTGQNVADIMADNGIYLRRASNDRVSGWLALREWLMPVLDEHGGRSCRLRIFSTCKNLIESMRNLQTSQRDPNDAAGDPHEYTHATDALRYFIASRPIPTPLPAAPDERLPIDDQIVSLFTDL